MASDNNPIDELLAQMNFASREHMATTLTALYGVDAENFINSPTGKLMIAEAQRQIDEFVVWCMTPDADSKEFYKKRANAMAARNALTWLADTITSGHVAARQAAAIEATHPD